MNNNQELLKAFSHHPVLFIPQVETSANYVVQNEDYLTKFTLNDCERRHTGIYKIHAKNDSGSDEADLEIVVLGESPFLDIYGYWLVSCQCNCFIHFQTLIFMDMQFSGDSCEEELVR